MMPSKSWTIQDNQWVQEYWTLTEKGEMEHVVNDNSGGSNQNENISVADFIARYDGNPARQEPPYPEIVAYLKALKS